jgi:hypothetical protein
MVVLVVARPPQQTQNLREEIKQRQVTHGEPQMVVLVLVVKAMAVLYLISLGVRMVVVVEELAGLVKQAPDQMVVSDPAVAVVVVE